MMDIKYTYPFSFGSLPTQDSLMAQLKDAEFLDPYNRPALKHSNICIVLILTKAGLFAVNSNRS